MSIAEHDAEAQPDRKREFAGIICDFLGHLIQQYYTDSLTTTQGVCCTIGDWCYDWCIEHDVEMDSENVDSSPYNMWYAYKGEPMKSWPRSTGNRFYPVPHPDHMDDDEREWDEDGEPPYHATWGGVAFEECVCYFEGEYGALRIDLAKHTLQFFREMRDGEE